MDGYRLDPERSFADEVRRLALEELTRAAALLRDPEAVDDLAVHEVRKHIKKTRAVLRLARGSLPGGLRREENQSLREAARLLAALRESAVLRSTLDGVVRRGRGLDGSRGLATVRANLTRAHSRAVARGLLEAVPEVRRALEELAQRVEGWPIAGERFEVVEGGLLWAYRQGRKGHRRALADRGAVAFHEWRKRVKDLWYHHRLLNALWPEMVGAWTARLEELSELLGEEHDLHELDVRLQGRSGGASAEAAAALRRRIVRRRRDLRRKALRLGALLYAERPRGFVERLRAWLAGSW